jgi:protein-disulfide isomerase
MAKAPPKGLNRFYLLLGGAALLGVAALAYLILRPKAISIPANVTVLAGDTTGFRGYVIGSDSAAVEITEYADFECPACGVFALVQWPSVRDRLVETGRLRWRYRDWPIDQLHPYSRIAAHAAACANDQGKYWEMHDALFAGQRDWVAPRKGAASKFRGYAKALALNLDEYDQCMQSAMYAGRIQASLDEGSKLGVGSTPTFLIDGRLYSGVLSSDSIGKLVDRLTAAATTPEQ